MAATKKNSKIIVVFDTNVLFTESASDLVKQSVAEFIKENSIHNDLNVEWYLPEVVVEERKYQMLEKAKELLPNLKKLEKLIGHSFGVGDDTLSLHVDNSIQKNLQSLHFKVIKISTNDVNWDEIISRSVSRQPPFEAGKKEKGFRDSIIGQSFLQLHKKLPKTPTICRLALVTNDGKLKDYIKEKTAEYNNIRLLSTIDDLENLVNTIISEIPEELVNELTEKAEKLFFEKSNKNNFYYKNDIGDKLEEQYSDILTKVFSEDQKRKNGTFWISSPIFLKKERQTLYWSTTIGVEFELYRNVYQPQILDTLTRTTQSLNYPANMQNLGNTLPPQNFEVVNYQPTLMELAGNYQKEVDYNGREKFDVRWTTTLSAKQTLITPKLKNIIHIGVESNESNG